MQRNIQLSYEERNNYREFQYTNITIVPGYVSPILTVNSTETEILPRWGYNISVAANSYDESCYKTARVWSCDVFPWPGNIDEITVTANLSRGLFYVQLGQGDLSDVRDYSETIPAMQGSHLSSILVPTVRQIFSKTALDLMGFTKMDTKFLVAFENIDHIEYHVSGLPTDPFPPNSGADILSLHLGVSLSLKVMGPVRFVQDYNDASVLTGLATFGGFWTFFNGAFAMFFGANLLYFIFRRRSLSALGIVHIFQRRALTQRWNEDFPTLHTEDGQPGSESAGIVAFLRQRLVDLDEEEPEGIKGVLEGQNPSSDTLYEEVSTGEPDGKGLVKRPPPDDDFDTSSSLSEKQLPHFPNA
ncbi:hypothetical protein C8J56DRAFT_1048462 [Mycena floridula]|nr:hypothetical protein C8J56DRAFT_1048462 [Mycena floridula]